LRAATGRRFKSASRQSAWTRSHRPRGKLAPLLAVQQNDQDLAIAARADRASHGQGRPARPVAAPGHRQGDHGPETAGILAGLSNRLFELWRRAQPPPWAQLPHGWFVPLFGHGSARDVAVRDPSTTGEPEAPPRPANLVASARRRGCRPEQCSIASAYVGAFGRRAPGGGRLLRQARGPEQAGPRPLRD